MRWISSSTLALSCINLSILPPQQAEPPENKSEADSWEVLADSRAPEKFVPRGRWTLMDELSLNGTVVQAAGGNTCSLKYKGWPLDQWGLTEFPDRPFRKIVGYHAREGKRATTYDACQQKDNAKARRTICTVEYPLIERGWDRDVVEARLFTEFGFVWPKSYCEPFRVR
ncbi:hypothetical protein NGM37_51660 [Streptomyces sp. TRM76130]|nr:hypothetical protein [Streptomyces sp. TRM76130]